MRLPTDAPENPPASRITDQASPQEIDSTIDHISQPNLIEESDDGSPPQYTPRENSDGTPEDPSEYPQEKKEDTGPPEIITPMIDRTDDSLTRITSGEEMHNPVDDANFYPFEPMFMLPNPGTGLPKYQDVSHQSPATNNLGQDPTQADASSSTTSVPGLPTPEFDDKGGEDLGEVNVALSDDVGTTMQGDGWDAGAKVLGDGRIDIKISPPKHGLSRSASLSSLSSLFLQQGQLRGFPSPTQHSPPAPSTEPLTHACSLPKLNVLMQIIGSRGDIQPFLSLALVLASPPYSYRVRVGTHECFHGFVEEVGRMIPQHSSIDKPGSIEFFCIGGDPHELMSFMVKNPGLMPGVEAVRSGEIGRRRRGVWEVLMGGWNACFDRVAPPYIRGVERKKPFVADVIIANPPGFGHLHCAERLGIPVHLMFTMPWSPTQGFPHPLANIQSPPPPTLSPSSSSTTLSGKTTSTVILQPGTVNFLSYALVEMMTWQGTGDLINRFREKVLGLEPLSSIWAPGSIARLKIPHTYCWSPSLIPKPGDWGEHISVSGFWFLDLAKSGYEPPVEVVKFLGIDPISGSRVRKEGERPIIYIGFGSIVVEDPQRLTALVQRAVKLANVKAVVSKGWGTIAPSESDYDPDIQYLGNTPHDWLFQHVDAVVHHGGAGTTAAGIRAGKPNVIIPFFGDQMFWGQMVHRAGAGPSPVPYNSKAQSGDSVAIGEREILTSEVLASMILEAVSPNCQLKAKEMGATVQQERGQEVAAIEFVKGVESWGMQCWVEEERRKIFPNAPKIDRIGVFTVKNGWLKSSLVENGVKVSSVAAVTLIEEGEIDPTSMKLSRHVEYDTAHEPFEPITGGAGALLGTMGSIIMGLGVDMPKDIYKVLKSKEKEVTANTVVAGDGSSTRSLADASTDNVSIVSQTSGTSIDKLSIDKDKPLPPPPASPGLSPGATNTDGRKTPTSSGAGFNFSKETLDKAIQAGSSIGKIVEAGLKSPMDFTMGVTQGFHNAPKLYGDETVRKTERVTGFQSGLKAAGREFTLGIYDGISGLVSHPYKGAKEEGAAGFIKGMGKGIGGLVLKPSAGMFAVPGYAMMGLHKEIKKRGGGEQIENIIKEMRIQEGYREYEQLTPEEKVDIITSWKSLCKKNGEPDNETRKGGLGIATLVKKEKVKQSNTETENKPDANTASTPSGLTTLQSFFADWKAKKHPLQQKAKAQEKKKKQKLPKEEVYVRPEDYEYPFPAKQNLGIHHYDNQDNSYENQLQQQGQLGAGYTLLDDNDDEELQRVLRISSIEHQQQQSQPPSRTNTGLEDDLTEEEMLERAIRASVEEFKSARRREMRGDIGLIGAEGEVVDEEAEMLERAMRMSLRQDHEDKGNDTEDDEDFKKALEESARTSKGKARESDYGGYTYRAYNPTISRTDYNYQSNETGLPPPPGGGPGQIFGGTIPDHYSTQEELPPKPTSTFTSSTLLPASHPLNSTNPFASPDDPPTTEPLIPPSENENDDEDLARALEISRRETEEAERRKKQEEEIVLSYILKASLEEREREKAKLGTQ